MPAAPTYSLLSINAQWPGFASTLAKAGPWAPRCAALAKTIRGSGASIIVTQETGRDSLAQLVTACGEKYSYQRAQGDTAGQGLNGVIWDDTEWEWVKTNDFVLPSWGQMTRTFLLVKLAHRRTEQYVWAGSFHLAAGPDLTKANAEKARLEQIQRIAKITDGYRQVIIGGDANNRGMDGPVRSTLTRAGWTVTEPKSLAGDAGRGIDLVAAKSRVKVQAVSVLPLGAASDHDGRRATFTIPNGGKSV